MNYVGVTEEDCMSSVLSEIRLRRLDSVMHKRKDEVCDQRSKRSEALSLDA